MTCRDCDGFGVTEEECPDCEDGCEACDYSGYIDEECLNCEGTGDEV